MPRKRLLPLKGPRHDRLAALSDEEYDAFIEERNRLVMDNWPLIDRFIDFIPSSEIYRFFSYEDLRQALVPYALLAAEYWLLSNRKQRFSTYLFRCCRSIWRENRDFFRVPVRRCQTATTEALRQALRSRTPVALADLHPDAHELAQGEDEGPHRYLQLVLDTVMAEALDEQERRLIEQRFGLNGQPVRTLQEIGKDLGISKQGVQLIEKKILLKLRDQLVASGVYAA